MLLAPARDAVPALDALDHAAIDARIAPVRAIVPGAAHALGIAPALLAADLARLEIATRRGADGLALLADRERAQIGVGASVGLGAERIAAADKEQGEDEGTHGPEGTA
jgi:hypothetical protein